MFTSTNCTLCTLDFPGPHTAAGSRLLRTKHSFSDNAPHASAKPSQILWCYGQPMKTKHFCRILNMGVFRVTLCENPSNSVIIGPMVQKLQMPVWIQNGGCRKHLFLTEINFEVGGVFQNMPFTPIFLYLVMRSSRIQELRLPTLDSRWRPPPSCFWQDVTSEKYFFL